MDKKENYLNKIATDPIYRESEIKRVGGEENLNKVNSKYLIIISEH